MISQVKDFVNDFTNASILSKHDILISIKIIKYIHYLGTNVKTLVTYVLELSLHA